jgi:DNA-binding MurR/RpiR family transcriptional regulator
VLSPTATRPALADSAASLGAAGSRLLAALTDGWPQSLQVRPAQLLRTARATPAQLQQLLEGAGLGDFDELRRRAEAEHDVRLPVPDLRFTERREHGSAESADSRALLGRLLHREQENLSRTLDGLHHSGALELAATAVLTGRRRYVVGDQKSAGYAALFAADLAAALPHVTLVQPSTKAVVDALCDVRPRDVLVAFSFRRYSRLTLAVAAEFRAAGGTVVGITDSVDGPLAGSSDHVLVVATRSEAHADSPTTVVAVGHSLAALASAGAKGAQRRRARRSHLARALDVYALADPAGPPPPDAASWETR